MKVQDFHNHVHDALHEPSGALLIGGFLQFFLQGIIIVQAVQYWESYPTDPRKRRAFVAFIVTLSLVQTALEGYKVWRATVNRKELEHITGAWFTLFLNNFICGVNKVFLLRRCWRITNQNKWVILLFVLTVSTFGANLLITATAAKIHFSTLSPHLSSMGRVAFTYFTSVSLFLDVVLASILVHFLWRSRTGMDHLDWALIRFFAITTESAIWPALCMATAVGLYNSGDPASISLVLFFLLLTGKLYTLSFLRHQNARASLHRMTKSDDLGMVSLGNWRWEGAIADYQSSASISHTTAHGRLCGSLPETVNTLGSAPLSSIIDVARIQHLRSVSSHSLESPQRIYSNRLDRQTRELLVRRTVST